MTKLEIINETIEYYSTDVTRRAVIGDTCCYLTEVGKYYVEDLKTRWVDK